MQKKKNTTKNLFYDTVTFWGGKASISKDKMFLFFYYSTIALKPGTHLSSSSARVADGLSNHFIDLQLFQTQILYHFKWAPSCYSTHAAKALESLEIWCNVKIWNYNLYVNLARTQKYLTTFIISLPVKHSWLMQSFYVAQDDVS